MTRTITAKDLRLNMKKVLIEASQGGEFEIVYRSKVLAKIVPKNQPQKSNNKKIQEKALADFTTPKSQIPSSKKSLKELYKETLKYE